MESSFYGTSTNGYISRRLALDSVTYCYLYPSLSSSLVLYRLYESGELGLLSRSLDSALQGSHVDAGVNGKHITQALSDCRFP